MLFHFHGHTEQGVRTAARIFGRAVVISGLRATAWIPNHLQNPALDSLSAYVWVGNEELAKGMPNASDADMTLIFDPTLLDPKTIKEQSTLIINSLLKVQNPIIKKRKIRAFSIDAVSHISRGKRSFPNLVILGYLTTHFKKITPKAVKQAVEEYLGSVPEKQAEVDVGSKLNPIIR